MAKVDVLIPTCDRITCLAVTLTALTGQQFADFDIIVADQGEKTIARDDPHIQAVSRLLERHGHSVTLLSNLPRCGMAQQRQFLLDHATAPYVLFIDDDVMLEPFVLQNMVNAIEQENCGFVGQAVIGLSYRDDKRAHEQYLEFWNGPVLPETITPDSPAWQRYKLHNAANVLHVQEQHAIGPDKPRKYKVAWVGGCVMYDAQKLRDVGAFSFWQELPKKHAGEDVLAQLRVMKRYGGCGLLPSGAYHQELPTTIRERPVDAPKVLPV